MSPLHRIGDLLRSALLGLPLGAVRALFVLSLTVLLVWVLRLPRGATSPHEAPTRPSENLKVWAALALAIQIAIYLFF
jgi:hypothetical protein